MTNYFQLEAKTVIASMTFSKKKKNNKLNSNEKREREREREKNVKNCSTILK